MHVEYDTVVVRSKTPFSEIGAQIKTRDYNVKKLTINDWIYIFSRLVFIDVDLVCNIFRGGLIFEEVILILCLFIGYQPQFFQKSNFSH